MRRATIAMLVALMCIAAGETSKPSTQPTKKTRYSLVKGGVKFMMPADWKLTSHSDDDHNIQFQSPDGKSVIVVFIQDEPMGFPVHNDQMIEKMKTMIITGMKKNLQERGVKVLYGPRSESDSDFLLRIHTRYVDNDQTCDEMQTYRSAGLEMFQVMTQAKTDKPSEAKACWAVGDDVALGMILSQPDRKKPAAK
jgi:hypothetical protein